MSESKKSKKKEKIIGIDLGTSNSACAVINAIGKPEIVPAAEGTTLGGKAFPSYVAFNEQGQKIVGEPARRQAVSNPDGTITAIKRKMGTSYKAKIKVGSEEIDPYFASISYCGSATAVRCNFNFPKAVDEDIRNRARVSRITFSDYVVESASTAALVLQSNERQFGDSNLMTRYSIDDEDFIIPF